MRVLAGDGDVVPALAERALHDADRGLRVFEHRALLDVCLEVSADLMRPRVAGVADGLERIADADTVGIFVLQDIVERVDAGEDAGAHERRHEARALFVGPGGDLERRVRMHAGVVQRADHFQAGHDAVGAIELAAVRLAVEVAAHDDGRRAAVGAFAAGEYVADAVHAHLQPGLAAPAHEELAAFAVLGRERHATHAALGRGADPGELHERRPEALAFDAGIHIDASLIRSKEARWLRAFALTQSGRNYMA